MGALRAGVKTVIIPADNVVDLEDIDQTVRAKLEFVSAENIDDILDVALVRKTSETQTAAAIPVPGQELLLLVSVAERPAERSCFRGLPDAAS